MYLSFAGLLWIQQGSGDIFTYTPDRQNCASVQSPRPGSTFLCISACPEAVWVLLENGDVYIRTGIGKVYPQGGGWFKLDLTQIGKVLSRLMYLLHMGSVIL